MAPSPQAHSQTSPSKCSFSSRAWVAQAGVGKKSGPSRSARRFIVGLKPPSESIVEIDDDESLSIAIKSEVDTVRAQDRSKPLWGLGIKVDKLTYGRRHPASTSPDLKQGQEHGAEPKPAS